MPPDELRGDKLIVFEDPRISGKANELIAEEMRAATGARELELRPPKDAASTTPLARPSDLHEALWDMRALIGTTGALLVVVIAILAVTSGQWWGLVVAIVVLFAMTGLVVARYARGAGQREHLDPDTAADLQAEGMLDPDGDFGRRMAALRRVP